MPKPKKPLYHSGGLMTQECGVRWHGKNCSISGGRNTKPGECLSDVYLQVNPGATEVQAPTFCALSLNWAACKLWFFKKFFIVWGGKEINYYFQVKKKKMKVKNGDKKLTSWFKKETENLILFKLRVITWEQPPINLWELFRSLEVKAQLPTFLRQSAVRKHSLYHPDPQVESEEWLMGHSGPLQD